MSKHKYISFKDVIARENAHVIAPASFRNFSISEEKPELLALYTNMPLNKEVYDNLSRPKTSALDGGLKKLLPMIMMCFRKIKECAECLINLVKSKIASRISEPFIVSVIDEMRLFLLGFIVFPFRAFLHKMSMLTTFITPELAFVYAST
ncbi:hypothetical protein Tco_1073203 [Tanacetum coccineum]